MLEIHFSSLEAFLEATVKICLQHLNTLTNFIMYSRYKQVITRTHMARCEPNGNLIFSMQRAWQNIPQLTLGSYCRSSPNLANWQVLLKVNRRCQLINPTHLLCNHIKVRLSHGWLSDDLCQLLDRLFQGANLIGEFVFDHIHVDTSLLFQALQ